MDKRKITHGLMVIAIVVSVFIAAAFTPIDTYTATSEKATVTNLAKVDFENRMVASDRKMIADNEVPLAALFHPFFIFIFSFSSVMIQNTIIISINTIFAIQCILNSVH